MKHPPTLLYFLAGAMLAIAISFPLQVISIYGFNLTQIVPVFSKITSLNYMIMFTCALSIPLILRSNRWMVATLVATAVLVVWNNLIVGFYGADFSILMTTLASVAFIGLELVVFHPKIMMLLKDPKQRWWLQSARKQITLPVTVNVIRGQSFAMETFDISESGLFTSFDEDKVSDEDVRPGDVVDVHFNLGLLRNVHCQAEVVRKNPSNGKYPSGLGIRFTDLSRHDRSALKRYLDCYPY